MVNLFKWLFDPWSKKKVEFTSREENIIRRARDKISVFSFKNLYIDQSKVIRYKAEGFDSEEEAKLKLISAAIATFLRNNNDFKYLLDNSAELYSRFKKSNNLKIRDSLALFLTIKFRLTKDDYIIRPAGDKYYPETLCKELPEETARYYIEILNPLIEAIENKYVIK